MKTYLYILFLFVFCCKTSSTIGQTHLLNCNDDVIRLDSGIYEFSEKGVESISIDEAVKQQRLGNYSYVNKQMPSYWMSNEGHWLYFKLLNKSTEPKVIEVNNALISELDAYVIGKDSVPITMPATGWRAPVTTNIYHTYKSCYKLTLDTNKVYEFFIRVKRTQSSLKVPILIWTENAFLKYLHNENFKYGFFSGLILFISIFSFAIYLYLRDKKYLFYSLYCISVLFWRLIVEGFTLEFFQHNLPYFQNPIWASVFNMFSALFAIIFLEKFLLNEQSPRWHFALNRVTRIGILLLSLSMFVYGETPLNGVFPTLYYILIICIVLNMVVFIYSGIKRKQLNAFIYLVSVFPILVYITIVTSTNLLELPTPFYLYDSFLWMLLFEIVTLLVGLAINFKKFVDEKGQMLQELNVKQKEAFLMQVKLQEEVIKRAEAQVELKNEKERISRDLHDSIGTDLSNIIYNIEYVKYEFADNKELSNAFEKLSLNAKHTMGQLRSAIWVLNHDTITLELFINKLNSHIYRILEDKPEVNYLLVTNEKNKHVFLPVMQVLYLYRVVQESLSNTLKYAKATKIKLTITLDDNQLQLIFSDNGVGFNVEDALEKETYGLKNIKKRVEELNAKLTINSGDFGTEINLQIPLNKHD
ncbi:MAG: 7TM diverse intracellular signaling domain-containing protein [Bacteroidota bacterium]